MIMSAPARTQELHSRIGDGILVQLLWRADDDHLFVSVTDSKEDVEFCVEVRDRTRALDVFHHPFAYAAHYGVHATPTRPRVPVTAAVSA
jgi:hypothetical protein